MVKSISPPVFSRTALSHATSTFPHVDKRGAIVAKRIVCAALAGFVAARTSALAATDNAYPRILRRIETSTRSRARGAAETAQAERARGPQRFTGGVPGERDDPGPVVEV